MFIYTRPYNTTIYGMDDGYRGIYNERRVVLMNPEDMKNEELQKETLHLTDDNYNNKTVELMLLFSIQDCKAVLHHTS